MTLVRTFIQQHYHHHHHRLLCTYCLFHSICLNPRNSSIIHLLHPPCFTSSCPESVSSARHQRHRLHTSHPVSQNQGPHSIKYVKAFTLCIFYDYSHKFLLFVCQVIVTLRDICDNFLPFLFEPGVWCPFLNPKLTNKI